MTKQSELLSKDEWSMVCLAVCEAQKAYKSASLGLPLLVADKVHNELMDSAKKMFDLEEKIHQILELAEDKAE